MALSCLVLDSRDMLPLHGHHEGPLLRHRARVRDALGQLDGYHGASGRIVWDNGGGNVGLAMRSLPVRAAGIP